MSNPPITNIAKPEDLKTQAKWDQLGRDTVGPATHKSTFDNMISSDIPLWHINHTKVRTKRNQS